VIRPLNHLRRDGGIRVDYVPTGSEGRVDPDEIARRIRPETTLVVVNHGSNVIGTIQPVAEIGRICREREIRFVVDVAQTAGVVPIHVQEMNIDALAFTGHKSMLAPTGIGGL
jgi:selenocysteine lyase/cysteine desulfurase